MWLDLYMNDQYEITAYAHNTADYASASNALVLSLNVGKKHFEESYYFFFKYFL